MNPITMPVTWQNYVQSLTEHRLNQYGGTTCRRPSFSRVYPDTIGYAWTGELVRFEYATSGRGNSSIRQEKVVDLKISGYMWGPFVSNLSHRKPLRK